jgi:hypothetical protein
MVILMEQKLRPVRLIIKELKELSALATQDYCDVAPGPQKTCL